MSPSKVGRFSQVVRVIGGVLLVPSFIGMFIALLMFISAVMTTGSSRTPHSDAEAAGQAVGFGIVFIITFVVGIISFVGGLLGWLLLSNRNVFKCERCGFILDRA
jgi:hypothetical protein